MNPPTQVKGPFPFLSRIVGMMLFFVMGLSNGSANAEDQKEGIAALVNGVAITNAEVDAVQRRADQQYEAPGDLRTKILSGLVKSELFAQMADKAGLDTPPNLRAEALIHRRNVAAGLAKERIAADLPNKLTPDDPRIDRLISRNPKLFKDRKLFVFDESPAVTADAAFWTELGDGDSPDELRRLDEKYDLKIAFETKALFSNQVPPGLLPAFESASVGPLLVVKESAEALVGRFIEKTSVYDAPLIGKRAERAARVFIENALVQQAFEQKVKAILETAEITYPTALAPATSGKRVVLPRGVSPQQKTMDRITTVILIAGLLFSLVVGFLATVSARRYWNGRLYVPNLSRFSRGGAPQVEINLPVDPFPNLDSGSVLGRLMIFALSPLFLMILAAHIYVAFLDLKYAILLIVLLAVPLSMWLAYKYSQSSLRIWSRNRRMVPVVIFSGLATAVSLLSVFWATQQ